MFDVGKTGCAERIVFAVDLDASGMAKAWMVNGKKATRLDTMKQLIRLFVSTKHLINANHQFGLLAVASSAYWLCDFTSDTEKFFAEVDALAGSTDSSMFDVSSIFRRIREHMPRETLTPAVGYEAPYSYRCILLYARQFMSPTLKPESAADVEALRLCPFFSFDFLMLHDGKLTADQTRTSQAVFDSLSALEGMERGVAMWAFEVGSGKTINSIFTRFLAHPQQRSSQDKFRPLVVPS